MMKKEALLPADERMDFVAIVTPNHVHFPAAKAALEHGFHVVSDKPATFNLAEARELGRLLRKTHLPRHLEQTRRIERRHGKRLIGPARE
jgi:predicted dehydrogenase